MARKTTLLAFILFAGTSAVSISTVNAVSTNNAIEITTALLRGPAAYLEYELRNDTSRSAHAKKALIAAIRLVNDLHSQNAQPQHHAFGWFVYDAKEIFVHLKASLTTQKNLTVPTALAQNATEQKLSDNKDYQFLRRIVLPTLEMLSALARTKFIKIRLPYSGGNFAAITTTLSRLLQIYFAAPKNSSQRKIIIGLLAWCVVDIIKQAQHLHTISQRELLHQDANHPEKCPFCNQEKPNDLGALQCRHISCRKCVEENDYKCPGCDKEFEVFFRINQHGEHEAPLEKPGEPDINENQNVDPGVPPAVMPQPAEEPIAPALAAPGEDVEEPGKPN
ncbi:MAG: hypothetical protein WC365_02875 [Candidatus Babeliales bacterium]|jgi:hypothetical protein